jgi:biotin synthase
MRVSTGTAINLGLIKGKMDFLPQTAYLLVGDKCSYSCKYCGVNHNKIARVEWKKFEEELIIEKLKVANFKRVCIQTTSDGKEATLDLIPRISMPVSICINSTNLDYIERALNRGAETVGIPLDACTPELAEKVDRPDWSNTLKLLIETAKLYPSKIWTHLIIGLGETEKQAVELIKKLYENGIGVALFAFTPVKHTSLEGKKRGDLSSYRRIQLARWALSKKKEEEFEYNSKDELASILIPEPDAYMTSGCRFCDRIFYDSSPLCPYNFSFMDEKSFRNAVEETFTWKSSAMIKAEKLLKVELTYGRTKEELFGKNGLNDLNAFGPNRTGPNRIKSLRIFGDFFAHPENVIDALEENLKGKRIEETELMENIEETIKNKNSEIFGFEPEDLAKVIVEACK